MPSATTSGTPPTRDATTGRPAASVSIALTGVPSFATAGAGRRRRGTRARRRPGSRRSSVACATPSSRASASSSGAVGAVADHHERRVDAAVAQQARASRRTSWARLTAVIRPTQPTVNRSGGMPSEARSSSPLLRALHALGELDAEPHDRELRRRRDADRDELVADLGADGDERIGRRARARARSGGRRAASPGRSSPRSVWPWNVWTTTGGRALPASRAATRPTAPALAVCVWRTCGRSCRISSARRRTRRASRERRDLALELRACDRTSMPRCSATNAIDASPSRDLAGRERRRRTRATRVPRSDTRRGATVRRR